MSGICTARRFRRARNRIGVALTMLLALVALAPAASAAERYTPPDLSEPVTLTVHKHRADPAGAAVAGAEAYTATRVLAGPGGAQVDLGTAAGYAAAAALKAGDIARMTLSGPVTAPVGTDGDAVFRGLVPGLYYVVESGSGAAGATASVPFLVMLPTWDRAALDGAGQWAYDVTAEPKNGEPGAVAPPSPSPKAPGPLAQVVGALPRTGTSLLPAAVAVALVAGGVVFLLASRSRRGRAENGASPSGGGR
ncbi:hypothetical protein ET495_11800 [Xylanimonas allomyrinae]|uniref:LPXTG cell wall anchor domain-containing protein n=1 Tax=Xylanimonas allomyrinae TaxID=2509459 RepID=A0A4V0YED3_9MICO|nr:hypothetical protein [Xylanimonas allomyrinae]QAY63811.1 hypothetical protein ET495_11800 [Xylanimonas allomyrinae]